MSFDEILKKLTSGVTGANAASSIVGIGTSVLPGIFADYGQETVGANATVGEVTNLKQIEEQEYDRPNRVGMFAGDILKGAGAGAVGGIPGIIAGAGIGLVGALIKNAKMNKEEKKFELDKEGKILDARNRNMIVADDRSERLMGAASVNEQIKNFYRNIPF
ncbi:hypothetical protein [uncultured Sphaerochaeta sp.]|uniref:hypothetical protein n=1 Tax=uncultured Sphaerochaeta sp. TaxID=886478 RepID=UPI00262FBE75|nr:hypothetical protein [uncultured Sphaerochaeta sp.]